MATFIAVHRSPGMSTDEIAANAPLVAECEDATFRHLYVNLLAGFIVTIYEGEDQAAVESEFERIGFPWDEIHEVQFETDLDGVKRLQAQGSAG